MKHRAQKPSMKSLASLEKTQLKARLKTKTSQHPRPPPLEWMKRNTPPFFDFLELLHGCYDFLRNSGQPKTFWAAKVLLPTKKVLKRPLNLLYPLECGSVQEIEATQDGEQLEETVEDTSTTLRPTRAAATRAQKHMQRLLSSEIGTFSWLGSVAEFPRI